MSAQGHVLSHYRFKLTRSPNKEETLTLSRHFLFLGLSRRSEQRVRLPNNVSLVFLMVCFSSVNQAFVFNLKAVNLKRKY